LLGYENNRAVSPRAGKGFVQTAGGRLVGAEEHGRRSVAPADPGAVRPWAAYSLAARLRDISFQLGMKYFIALSRALSMQSMIAWPNCVAFSRSAS